VNAQMLQRVKRTAIVVACVVFLSLAAIVFTWNTFFHFVEPGQLAVVIAKSGDDPPEGQLLADPGEKGPLKDVLAEGRHFVLPFFNEVEIRDLSALGMVIPANMIGVVTAKVGDDLPPGQILAEPGQKGILRTVLPPGWHRLNPYGYEVEQVPATIIRPGFVGFVTSLVGAEQTGQFAPGSTTSTPTPTESARSRWG